jgi:hypothetical protein
MISLVVPPLPPPTLADLSERLNSLKLKRCHLSEPLQHAKSPPSGLGTAA